MPEQVGKEVYENLINWYGQTWWELTESDHLWPMIMSYITPEEAEFLTGFPHRAKKVEELAELKDRDPEELRPYLKKLAVRGLLFEDIRKETARYRLNDTFFVFLRAVYWPGNENEDVKAHARHINKYFLDGWFDQYKDVHWKGLRAIPIEKTIEDTRSIMPFEDIVKVIEDREYYSVSFCPCRHRHNLDEETKNCDHPIEVCLHFDDLGRYAVNNGQGREITREETFTILKKSADAGLVHGISTWQDKPDTICNCCNDACMWFEAYHKLSHGKSLSPSNYKIRINAETCRACGLCVRRCPMDALSLKYSEESTNKLNKAGAVDEDKCIGCGVCAHKCPTDSAILIQNEEIIESPKNVYEYSQHYIADRMTAKKKHGELTELEENK
jgi:ferredoxin